MAHLAHPTQVCHASTPFFKEVVMPRSRNIKYSFFTNDELAEIDPLGRLLFIGLWTIADYKGDLEWRPKKVKAELLPYDDCDIKELAINLDKSGFIRFYSDGDSIYLLISNFSTHQNPHKNEREKGSQIPEYTEKMRQAIDLKGLAINLDKVAINLDENGTPPADSLILIADSLSLDPDSGLPIPEPHGKPLSSNLDVTAIMEYLNLKTSKKFKSVDSNTKLVKARLGEGHTVEDILAVIDRKTEQWLNDDKMSQ